ncbi:MAG: RDD family protein [Gammaproteobacteria bacterium]|nr:RDD family protein [Gammaproteobacteria bacterium]
MPSELPKPSLLRHFAAMFYDSMLVIAVVAVVNAAALGVQVKLLGSASHELHPQLAQVLVLGSVGGFFIVFWMKVGQTLGMQAWRIRLVRFDGGEPRFTDGLLRCLAATVSAACLGMGYLWRLVDRRGRYWHDYLSRTELQLMAKDEASADTGPPP